MFKELEQINREAMQMRTLHRELRETQLIDWTNQAAEAELDKVAEHIVCLEDKFDDRQALNEQLVKLLDATRAIKRSVSETLAQTDQSIRVMSKCKDKMKFRQFVILTGEDGKARTQFLKDLASEAEKPTTYLRFTCEQENTEAAALELLQRMAEQFEIELQTEYPDSHKSLIVNTIANLQLQLQKQHLHLPRSEWTWLLLDGVEDVELIRYLFGQFEHELWAIPINWLISVEQTEPALKTLISQGFWDKVISLATGLDYSTCNIYKDQEDLTLL